MNYDLIVGEHNFKFDEGNEQIGYPAKIIIHPSYSPQVYIGDIAIVKIKKNLKYNRYIQPISIGRPAVQAIPGGKILNTAPVDPSTSNIRVEIIFYVFQTKLKLVDGDIQRLERMVNQWMPITIQIN